MKKLTLTQKLAPVLCSITTFAVVFVFITAFAKAVPDILWISARVIAAVAVAIFFASKFKTLKAMQLFLRSLVQDLLAYIFRLPLAEMLGISTVSPLWEFEYIGHVYAWICRLAVIQPLAVTLYRRTHPGK